MAQKTPTPPTPADDMPERVIAELDRHIADLEVQDKALIAEQIALEADGTEPLEPSNASVNLDARKRQFLNGHAGAATVLSGAYRLWEVILDRKAIALAIEDGRSQHRRAAIKLVTRALVAHEERVRPILERTRWLVEQLQAANRDRAALAETTLKESVGHIDWRAIKWSGFELLGLGNGTGMSVATNESYEFLAECERQGIRAKEIK